MFGLLKVRKFIKIPIRISRKCFVGKVGMIGARYEHERPQNNQRPKPARDELFKIKWKMIFADKLWKSLMLLIRIISSISENKIVGYFFLKDFRPPPLPLKSVRNSNIVIYSYSYPHTI